MMLNSHTASARFLQHDLPARDIEHNARSPGRGIRAQEQGGRRDVRRLSAKGQVLQDTFSNEY
jgi:hypothetical protein